MKDKRYCIGLLVANITDIFSNDLAKGAMRAAERLGADLFIFPGKYVGIQGLYEHNETKYEYQHNLLFQFAAEAKLDYLIVAVGTIAYSIDDEMKKKFLEIFEGTPVLSVASEIEGYDFLQFDNRSGITSAMDYLAARGRKRIGMLVGDLLNQECAVRYSAYLEGVAEYELEFEERFVSECHIGYECVPQVEAFVERNPDLDAIICVNDVIAAETYKVLAKRGKVIGKDVAVVGFDDQPFAADLVPPLASVKADAEQLAERAVEKAVNYLNGVEDNVHYTKTRFIPRQSCYADVRFLNAPETMFEGELDEIKRNMLRYFSVVSENEDEAESLCQPLYELLEQLKRDYIDRDGDLETAERTTAHVRKLLGDESPLKNSLSKVFPVVTESYIWLLRNCTAKSIGAIKTLKTLFTVSSEKISDDSIAKRYIDQAHVINIFIRDALMLGGDLKNSYAQILKRLTNVGSMTSFLYVHDEPVRHPYGEAFPTGLTWTFKSYCYGSESYMVPDEEQHIPMPEVFRNKYLDSDRRHTLVVADLYSAEDQYGIALLEPRNAQFFDELELVTYQLGSAVKMLHILRRQDMLLTEIHARNLALENESKIDELTAVYNRRGFYVAADKMINAPENKGGEFIVCFADMDNLKMVNDSYGHIEGDFSLRLTAECLRFAFGEGAVIGRTGGDEFAAIIPMRGELNAELVKDRKRRFVEDFNNSRQKPYIFGTSVGVIECRLENSYDLKAALDKADDLLYVQKSKRKKVI